MGFIAVKERCGSLYGYSGKLLRVDLTGEKLTTETISEELIQKYVGGRGLGAHFLYEEVPAGADPLGPENRLIFSTGPFDNTNLPGSSRYLLCFKSPLTGGWGDANAGGAFGRMLKRAGFDLIIVQGKASRPLYLMATDEEIALKDASHLWGLGVADTTEKIRFDYANKRLQVATIGPAGENLVRYACVINGFNRVSGRSGAGAVLGSKNLKAVVTFGSQDTEVAEPERLRDRIKELNQHIREDAGCQVLKAHGTASGVGPYNEMGMYPAYNFREGYSENINPLMGETMTDTILIGREACPGCPVACKRIVQVKEGPYKTNPSYGGPEFETVGALGSCVGVFNLPAVAKAHELCNHYGLDGINTGLSIAWAMECYEKGYLSKEDTGGLELTWGNEEALLGLIKDIAYKKGLGALLAEGLEEASRMVGRASPYFAMQVKNQAFAVHMPRAKVGQGLSYATSNRGACHMQGMHDETIESGRLMPSIGLDKKFRAISRMSKKLKPEFEVIAQDLRSFQDTLIICRFIAWDSGPITPAFLSELLRIITGNDYSVTRLMLLGERVYNLCRMFNVREGFNRSHDTLPGRVSEPLPRGASSGSSISHAELENMLSRYYQLRGWDDNGIPTAETLKRLGLDQLSQAKQ